MNRVSLRKKLTLNYGKSLPSKKRQAGEYPVFGSNGMIGTHNQYYVKGPGIIVGRKGSVGEVVWVEQNYWPIDTTYFITTNDKEDLQYWYYQLKCLKLNQLNSHAAVPGLNREDVYRLEVIDQPLSEQRKIAKILRDFDRRIELNRQMNETLEQMGQALFKHYFIDNPEAQNWQEKSLDEIASFLNGLAMQKYPVKDNNILPVIKIREMSSGFTNNTDIASGNIPEKYIVHDGDMLFSWSGTLMVKIWTEGTGALNQHLFKVTSAIYPQWFYCMWTKYYLKQFIETAKNKATTMGHIQRRHLSEAKVRIPPSNVLNKISALMVPIHKQKIENSLQIKTLSEIRNNLLPGLVSGKIKYE